jgi:WXG100 family type VII secretion target
VKYKVDLDELARVVESLEAFGSTLETQLKSLDRAMADLHVTWQGEAAAAHKLAHAKLATGGTEVHKALIGMHAAATKAHAHYHAAATANQQTWKQVR